MISDIKTTLQLLDKFNLRAKKGYGQNFLVDGNVLKRIIEVSGLDKTCGVIEIGPGMGSLTEYLVMNAKKVLAYEIDEDMINVLAYTLKGYDNLKVVNKDILKSDIENDFDYFKDCSRVLVISNLPYYITTAIITKLLSLNVKIDDCYFMVQKEVGDRLTSKPNTKDYNALSVLMAYKSNSKYEFTVKRNCFYPAPNVDSAIISVKPIKNDLSIKNEAKFLKFIQNIFIQRRKTFVNNVNQTYGSVDKEKYSKTQIARKIVELGYKETLRSEELDLNDIVLLYKELFEIK